MQKEVVKGRGWLAVKEIMTDASQWGKARLLWLVRRFWNPEGRTEISGAIKTKIHVVHLLQ